MHFGGRRRRRRAIRRAPATRSSPRGSSAPTSSAEKKSYVPTQDDVRRRERMVATNTLLGATARASLFEAVFWGILAAVAALAGLLFSREKPRTVT